MEEMVSQYQGSSIIRETAVRQLVGLDNNDLVGQVNRLIKFVKDNVTYVRDPAGSEYLISPARMISTWKASGYMAGDCDDHVILLNTLLGSIGIPSKAVGVKFGGASDFNHVITGIFYNGELKLIDPCAKGSAQPDYKETLMV